MLGKLGTRNVQQQKTENNDIIRGSVIRNVHLVLLRSVNKGGTDS
jgi:hypothetical protein